ELLARSSYDLRLHPEFPRGHPGINAPSRHRNIPGGSWTPAVRGLDLSRWETKPNRVFSRRSTESNLPPVATVVLNGREMTIRTILSLGWQLPWIIYDQCTPPKLLDFVKDMPDVIVLRPNHRSSVAYAWNCCLRDAWDRGAGIPVGLTIRAACVHAHFGSTPGVIGRVRRDLYYRRNRRRYASKWGDDRR